MDEREWFDATDPESMLAWLRGKVSARKLRLFAAACCRTLWPLLTDARSRQAVGMAERWADGLAGDQGMSWARNDALDAEREQRGLGIAGAIFKAASFAAAVVAAKDIEIAGEYPIPARLVADLQPLVRAIARGCDRTTHGHLLRCLVGNPFKPLPLRSFPTHVAGLAEAIYAAFPEVGDEYAILADALEELEEPGAAAHCRETLHAKGCHVVDWILEKE
jgi:hypothetical protein